MPSPVCFTCGLAMGGSRPRATTLSSKGQVVCVCAKRACARAAAVCTPRKQKRVKAAHPRRAPQVSGPIVLPDSWGNMAVDVLQVVRDKLDLTSIISACAACTHWAASLTHGIKSLDLPMCLGSELSLRATSRLADCRTVPAWAASLHRARALLPDARRCAIAVSEALASPWRLASDELLLNLHHLSRWTDLEALQLDQRDARELLRWDSMCFGALARLTGLTSLSLVIDVCSAGGGDADPQLHVLSSLVNLQRLRLVCTDGWYEVDDHKEWRYMSDLCALTALRDLCIDAQLLPAATLAALTAVTSLRLQDFQPGLASDSDHGLDVHDAALLSAVAALPRLRVLHVVVGRCEGSGESHSYLSFVEGCGQLLRHVPELRIDLFNRREAVCRKRCHLDEQALDDRVLWALAELPNLTHLSASYASTGAVTLCRLSELTRLTSLQLRVCPHDDLLAPPSLDDGVMCRWTRCLTRLTRLTLHLPPAVLAGLGVLPGLSRLLSLQHLELVAAHVLYSGQHGVDADSYEVHNIKRADLPRFDLAWLPAGVRTVDLGHLLVLAAPHVTGSGWAAGGGTGGGTGGRTGVTSRLPELERVRCVWADLGGPPAWQEEVLRRLMHAAGGPGSPLPALREASCAVEPWWDYDFIQSWPKADPMAGGPAGE